MKVGRAKRLYFKSQIIWNADGFHCDIPRTLQGGQEISDPFKLDNQPCLIQLLGHQSLLHFLGAGSMWWGSESSVLLFVSRCILRVSNCSCKAWHWRGVVKMWNVAFLPCLCRKLQSMTFLKRFEDLKSVAKCGWGLN